MHNIPFDRSAHPARAIWRPLAAVALLAALGMAAGAQSLLLKSGAIRPGAIPAARLAQLDKVQALAAGERRVVLVQWPGPVDEARLAALQAQGAELIQPIPEQGYLVSLPTTATISLKAANAPSWSSAMDPSWKIHPEIARGLAAAAVSTLAESSGTTKQVVSRYNIQVAKTGGEAAVQTALAGRGFAVRTLGAMDQVQILTVEADAAAVQDLSRMNSVIWIEPYREPRLASEREGTALSGNFNANYTDILAPGTYQTWLASTGITGSGVTVHIMDDGLSQGYYSNAAGTAHPDFLGRITGIENSTYDALGDSGGGHGNINASIIMGQPIAGGGGMTDKDGYMLGQGVAPNARIYATKIFNNNEYFEIKSAFDSLVSNGYIAGARISSNSWGAEALGEYDSEAQFFDNLTRDAVSGTSGLQPMAFVFAAVNSGPYAQTIGSPATAKNVISVGATENSDQGVYDRSGMGPSDSDDMRDVAVFSSRGPLADGRIGPTVVAIGTHVPGAASDSKNFSGNGVSGRAASSLEADEPATAVRYYPAYQTYYTWSSGTSHACPGVAGAAALFYEYYTKHYGSGPSPAMIKAALIAGAIDPVGGNDNRGGKLGFIPNNEVGWGFATLKGIVDGANQLFVRDQATVLRTNGETYTHDIQVPDSTKPLRIVLTWTDVPGFAGSSKALINDLDLTVTDGKSTWKGNVFSSGHSVEGGDADRLNNVECVFIARPSPSIYTITVTAHSLNGDALPKTGSTIEQDFALLVTNGADQSPVGRVSFDKTVYSCSDAITVAVSDSDLVGSGTATVTLSSKLTGDAETFVLHEVEAPSGIMRGTIASTLGAAVKNNGVLSIANGDTLTATYKDATLGSDGKALVATAKATLDCTAPGLGDVFVDSVTDETAQISVTANEAAQMTIVYGPAGDEAKYELAGASSDLAQTFALTGLSPQTPYFFKVELIDLAGNAATVGDGSLYYAFQTRSRVGHFGDTMESGSGSWTHSAAVGTDNWTIADTSYAHSASHAWYVTDPASRKDDSLYSPSITLPAGQARLEFWHTFEFEAAGLTAGYDGGVLEISTNGGSSWSDLGQSMLEGGYNSSISSYFGNPLAGRQAWSGGTFGDMHRVQVDLSSYAGMTVKLRWRIGCDSSYAGSGWYVDDVSVYSMGDETTNLALLRLDKHGVTNLISPLRFTIRDRQFMTGDDGATPSAFYVSVPGRLAPVAIAPTGLQLLSGAAGLWEGYLSVVAGSNGHVTVAGALDVAPNETVRLIYHDADADDGQAANVSDQITFDCQAPSLVSLTQTSVSDVAASYQLVASEPVTMTVHYGIAANALNTAQQATDLSATHEISFANLSACTPYYFTLELTDEAGNTSVVTNLGQVFGFRTSQQSVALDTLDPSPAGTWTHSAASGTDDWTYTIASTSWNYAQRSYVHSGSNAWSCQDVTGLKDDRLVMPPVTITSQTLLSFWHTYQTETKFDGGVIEISLDGGTTWKDLGTDITQGHYDDVISGAYGSALAYRLAWTGGTFGAMKQVIVDLSKYAGSNRLIRFRFACDRQYGGGGWMIDDIGLVTYAACGTQFPAVPSITSPANNATGVAFSGTKLSWAAVSGATGYEAFFGASSDSLALLGTTTDTYFVITPQVLKAGKTYYWSVRALNTVGAGNPAATSVFKTAPVDPSKIAGYIVGNAAALLTSEKKAVDYNDDGQITIDELVTDVNLSH